jgi:hypothetical protein
VIFSVGHSTHPPAEFLPLIRGIDTLIDIRSHPTSKWEWWRHDQMNWVSAAGVELIWQPWLGGWTQTHYAQYAEVMATVGVDVGAYSRGAFPKQRIGVDLPTVTDPACPLHGSGPKSPQLDRIGLLRAKARGWTPDPTATCICEGVSDAPRWTNRGLWDYSWYQTTGDFQRGLSWLFENYAGADQPNCAIMCAEALYWKCHRSMVADALWYRFGCDTLHLKPSLPKKATTSRFVRHSEVIGNRLERYEPAILESLATIPTPVAS